MIDTNKIENLVFKGGGVIGITYAGAIAKLEEEGYFQGLKRFAGTSVGALVATLLSVDYSSKDIEEALDQSDLTNLMDLARVDKMVSEYGVYKGVALLDWIKELIGKKTGNPEITFQEHMQQGYKELKVYATDVSAARLQEFSVEQTPDTIIAEAVRASMSIPYFFKAWKFTNSKPNDHIYVDGGVSQNFPISAFEDLEKTIGYFINFSIEDTSLGYGDITKFTRYMLKATMRSQEIDFFNRYGKDRYTIIIDNKGVASTDFNLSAEQAITLYNEGKEKTEEHLRKRFG